MGLTFVAVGMSLPEVAVSIIIARQGKTKFVYAIFVFITISRFNKLSMYLLTSFNCIPMYKSFNCFCR